jgi:hypothetical protein
MSMREGVHNKSSPELSVSEIYQEGLRLFMGQGELDKTLGRLVRNLKQHGIDYMVVGAVALIAHGYKRFSEDIYLVMTWEALDAFHRELVGRGYVPRFPGARKRFRSTADGVSIDELLALNIRATASLSPCRSHILVMRRLRLTVFES